VDWPTARDGLRRRGRTVLHFWFAHIWLAVATTVIGVALLVVVDRLAPSRPDPTVPGQVDIYGWGTPGEAIGIALTVLGVASLILWLGSRSEGSRAERIKRLTTALEESVRIIAEINSEVALGQERLADLEKETAVQQQLAKLTGAEAAAVREALKTELGLERRRSLPRDLALVLLGVGLGYIGQRFL
jgi:hypothetical protein